MRCSVEWGVVGGGERIAKEKKELQKMGHIWGTTELKMPHQHTS